MCPRKNDEVDKKSRRTHNPKLYELPHASPLRDRFEGAIQLGYPIPIGEKDRIQSEQR